MRKSIALLLVLLISLSLCPALAGCGATGGSPAAVIGTWEGEWDYNGAHIKCTLTVKDDGTYERTHVRDNIPSDTEKGDYEFADNILTTCPRAEAPPFRKNSVRDRVFVFSRALDWTSSFSCCTMTLSSQRPAAKSGPEITKEESIMAVCPNCGTQLPDGAGFCTECGQPLRAPAPAGGYTAPVNIPAPEAPKPARSGGGKTALILCLAVLLLAGATLGVLFLTGVLGGNKDYDRAMELFKQGQYPEAAALFEQLGDYKDSAELAQNCRYQQAQLAYTREDYEQALELFTTLGNYRDSADWAARCEQKLEVAPPAEPAPVILEPPVSSEPPASSDNGICGGSDEGDYEFDGSVLVTWKDAGHTTSIRYDYVNGALTNNNHYLYKVGP